MELVKFPSLHCSTRQELGNDRNKFYNDGQNNYCERRTIADQASALECNQILEKPGIEEDRDHPIFHIYLTMDMILKTLNRSELLRCRGISSNFNFFATHVLLTSPSPVSLHFEYNWELQQYIWSKPPSEFPLQNNLGIIDSSNYTLTNLSKLLETSTDFPCKKYTFRNGTLESKDIQTFLQLHGWDVRALSLEIYCPQTLGQRDEFDDRQHPCRPYIDLLSKLLLEQIPNVKSLKLSKFPALWKILKEKMYLAEMEKEIQGLKNSDNYPYLTSLKNLIIGVDVERGGNASSKLITEILETAINLENVYCPPSKAFRQSDKFHLLQGLPLNASCNLLKKHEQIAAYPRSRLRSITLMLHDLITPDYIKIQERFGKALHKILEASSSTLEHIHFQSPCGYLCRPDLHFKIPILPKVKCIEISTDNAYRLNESDCPKEIQTHHHLTSRYFPPGFQFKTTFPHLTQITFTFETSLNFNQFAAWEDHFDNYDPCLTVTSLIFMDCQILPSSCLLYCSQIFPNTEFLQIRALYFSFYDASLNGLFSFRRLKELRWDLHLNVRLRHPNEYPFLDAAFTGYSPQAVECLYQEFLNDDSHDQFDAFQGFQAGSPLSPSIQNLKDLEILAITVFERSQEIKAFPPMLTHVTNLFALKNQLRLQLQMDFIVHREENLQKIMDRMQPVRAFVEFINTRPRYYGNLFSYFDEEKIMQI